MKSRKEKKPRPSNIGRRTGVDVVQGKKIRRQDDGTDVFEDYWTDNESINSNHTNQSIQSPVKTRNAKILENVSILDRDSVSYRNAQRSSTKRSQRSGEHEDHDGYSRSEHLKRQDVSGKENYLEIGRRTGEVVIQGKKIRRQEDGTDIYDDYWTDYDSKRTSQSLRSSAETRSKRISENVSVSNRDSVDIMQTPRTFMKESLNPRSGRFQDHDSYSSLEQSRRSGISKGKSQLPVDTMETSDLMENRLVSHIANSHMENSAIGRSKMTQTSHLLDETESLPSKNRMHVHNKSRKSSRADLSVGEINSSVEKYSRKKSLRTSEQRTMQTPDLLENNQEIERIPSKNLTYLRNKSRKSSMANLSYGNANSSVQKYPTEKSQRTSESSMTETPDILENRQVRESIPSKNIHLHNKARKSSMANLSYGNANSSVPTENSQRTSESSTTETSDILEDSQVCSTADSYVTTALEDALQENVSTSKSPRRSSRYKKLHISPLQNEQLKIVNVSAEKEYECFEDHDDSTPDIVVSQSKRSGISREKSSFFEDVENSAIARSKVTQTSHLLDEIENTPSKNRMHALNKSRRSNGADLPDGKINSSVQEYSTKKSPRTSDRSTVQNPDLLENRQEMESILSENRLQMHNKSKKSSMADLSYANVNSSVQKDPTEKSQRKSERRTIQTPDLLENRQEMENTPSKNRIHSHNKSRGSNGADLSDGEINSSVQKYSTTKSPRTYERSIVRNSDLLENGQEIESILSENRMQVHNKSKKSNMDDFSNGNGNSSVQKTTEKSQRTSESSTMETPDLLENSQASNTADSLVESAPQDALQEIVSSSFKGIRRSSRYKIPPLASWRNERLKFVKVSAKKEYECIGVEGGQPEDDFAFRALKKRIESKVQKRKVVTWDKKRKNIPKNIKKTPILDEKTEKIIELYLHRPFSSYEWVLPPNEPGIMICRAFQSLFISFGFLDIAGHSMKDKQVSPLDNLYFAVVKGGVDVEINTTSFNFKKGDSFIVPRGTFYCMKNETSTNALLSYCSFKIPFFKFQEKD